MRKLIYWLLLPLAVAVSACGGKKGSSDNKSTLAMNRQCGCSRIAAYADV